MTPEAEEFVWLTLAAFAAMAIPAVWWRRDVTAKGPIWLACAILAAYGAGGTIWVSVRTAELGWTPFVLVGGAAAIALSELYVWRAARLWWGGAPTPSSVDPPPQPADGKDTPVTVER
jgi:hypothetical protein